VNVLYERLENRGLPVSKLALGAVTFGSAEGPMAVVGLQLLRSQWERNLAAANLILNRDELIKLDEITGPTPIYPNWFDTNIFDPQAKKALEG
jgi:hypothetical protein